jgi:lactate dehydrogenase-like 2-hydroxyacid dehydrogenase
MKPPVFLHSWVPDAILEDLRSRFEVDHVDVFETGILPPDEFARHAEGKHGIMVLAAPVGAELMKASAGTLKVVANVAVGVDNIDVSAATEAGVQVTNTPGVLTDAVADFSIAMLLAVGRRMIESDRYTRAGKFQGPSFPLFWGATVVGETLGIIGLGRIGQAVARRARGFGLELVYHNRNRVDAAVEAELGATWLPLDELLAAARYVLLLTPLTDETRHLIDADRLARMRRDAFLINVSRGPVVHEAALLDALQRGVIAGAALDNVVLTPHIASGTVETRHAMVRVAAENLTACLTGAPVPNPVNKV